MRYSSSRCPNCHKLAHRCACGTMQPHNQLSAKNLRNVPHPRDFMRPTQQQQYPEPGIQAPPGTLDVEALLHIPEVAQRVDQIVEEVSMGAVARYREDNPQQVVQEGPSNRDLMVLSNVKVEEIPGDVPEKNTGGRKNTWYAGRKEVHDFFVNALRELIMGGKNGEGNSNGEAPRNEAEGGASGTPEIPGSVPADNQNNPV